MASINAKINPVLAHIYQIKYKIWAPHPHPLENMATGAAYILHISKSRSNEFEKKLFESSGNV